MKNKTVFAILVLVLAAGVCFMYWRGNSNPISSGEATTDATQSASAAISMVDGKQVTEVLVKEGYQPREISAKAGVPLVLKMKTQATFDCSSTFSIPKLNIHAKFESTGETDIEIPAQAAGESLYGVCGMGMYSLVIKFT